MKIKEIIIESGNPTVDQIRKNCRSILPLIAANKVLLRGIRASFDIAEKTARLEDRRPKNTPERVHNAVNNWFEQRFGHPWRNGIFTTGKRSVASNYGNVYVCLPIGQFEFLYSPAVVDLFALLRDHPYASTLNDSDEKIKEYLNKLDNATFVHGNQSELSKLENAIDSLKEVMVWPNQVSPKYYLISEEKFAEIRAQL